MKKMTVIILTAALAAAIMSGCSGGSGDSSSKSDTSSTSSSASSESSSNSSKSDESKSESKADSKTESKSESSKETSTESKKSENQKVSTALKYKDVTITIDAEADPILKKFGTPDSEQTIKAENENEQDAYSYTYDNLTIYTNKKDGKQYIIDASINSPGDAATANDIKIGSSKEAVSKVYGTVTDDNTFTYEADGCVLIFTFQDDMVIDISLGRGLSE